MFDLELHKVIKTIQEKNSKQVLIQLPEGLKPKAEEVVEAIESQTEAQVTIWLGSCFGACDIPLGINQLNMDLFVQWGHNLYHKTREEW